MTARIFISYARKDGRDLALRLKASLEAFGQTVWIDTSEIDGGASWSRDIENAIDACETVLALLSKGSYESEICRSEQLRALRKKKRLIPILVQTDAERPIHIESSNYRDFSDSAHYDENFALLRADLSSAYIAPEMRHAPNTAPVLPNHFVERPQELEALRQAVLSDRTDRRIVLTALRGMGGIGKSVLANALCHEDAVRDAFPDGVFWVEIGREVSNLVEKLKTVALALGDDSANYASYDLAVSNFRLLLPQKSALIVLDDVWERGVITPFLVESPRSHWLVTTRDGNISAGLGATEVKLGTLDAGQALSLLCGWAGRDDAHFAEIADKLDYHPLALKLVGARLRDGMAAAEWIASYDGIARVKLGRNPKTTDESIELCFDASMTALSDDDRPLYHALGIFPEDVWVPEKIIMLFWRKRAGLSTADCTDILTELERLALVERDTDQRAIRMHDLLHSYNRHKIREQYATLQTEFVTALGDVYALPDDYAWRNLAYHLIEGGQTDRLYALLTDYRWLQAKLDATDVNALIDDYSAYLDAVRDGDTMQVVRLLQSALMMSAHVLNEDKSQLPYQLTGRLWTHRDQLSIAPLWHTCHSVTPLELIKTQEHPPMLQAGGALLRTLSGHFAQVRGALDLSDGRLLSWSTDDTLRLWSSDGQLLTVLTGHTGGIWGALALSDGRILSWAGVYKSKDHTLRLWAPNGQLLATLIGHTDAVYGALSLPNGRLLSWSLDSTLRLWAPDGQPLTTLTDHTSKISGVLALSDGRFLSWTRGYTSEDHMLRLWSSDGQPLASLIGHTDSAYGALALPDGRLLSWSSDSTLRLWSPDGQPLVTLTGHNGSVYGALALPDGRLLSWSNDRTLRLWSPDGYPLVALMGHTSSVYGALALPDGRILSWAGGYGSKDHTLRLWSSDGQPLASLIGHTDEIKGALALRNGRLLSWSSDGTLRLWSFDGQQLGTLIAHTDEVRGALALPDGRLLSWSDDGTLRLWSLGDQPLVALVGHTHVVNGALALPEGRLLSWSYEDTITRLRFRNRQSKDTTLRLWSSDGQPLASLIGHTDEVKGALALPDGRLLSWSNDSTLHLWSSDGQPLASLIGHTDEVYGAFALPDGRLLSWSNDSTLRLWSSDGQPLASLIGHTDRVYGALALSDGRLLSWSNDGTLRLWLSDGQLLVALMGHTNSIYGALALPNGRLLSWSHDHTLRMWSSDGQALATLSGHTSAIHGALPTPDGRVLSWSSDKTLRLWSSDGQTLATLCGHITGVTGALLTPDGRVLSWSDDQTLRLWSSDGQAVATLDALWSSQDRLIAWGALHGVDVRCLYQNDSDASEPIFARSVGNQVWIHGVGQFIGDARFTDPVITGDTVIVGDEAGRVIFLRVRGGGES